MAITETPKVKYYEGASNPTLNGEGGEIPIIIGISNNANPAAGIQKFKNFPACNASVANGGLGTSTTNNPLLAFLKDFFEENKKINSDDLSVPYVYVIDLGVGTTTTGSGNEAVTSLTTSAWTNAMALAKSKREVQAEVFVGFKKVHGTSDIIDLLKAAAESIDDDSEDGNPRVAYFTIEGCTDAELKDIADDTKAKFIQDSRVGFAEYLLFGKTVANILCTPHDEEPGYTDYRSVTPGTFTERTPDEEDELQAAGVIFNRDERAGSEIHPKINLAVSTAFGASPDSRPNDALLHARRNVDQLIREAYMILYTQLKRNETETNINYLQSDLDVLVNAKIRNGEMNDGTEINVTEDEVNPYDLHAEGVAVPVNSTLLIGFSMYIEQPNAISGGA